MKPLPLLLIAMFAATACDREARVFTRSPSTVAAPPAQQRLGELKPGDRGEGLTDVAASRTFEGDNAYEIAQGKRLFRWYNCNGCHSNGGGGMGPPLMDEKWIYGHEPDQIYATILEGRPNGMPSFRGRIPSEQAWQLVAYVRSMAGLASREVASARSDSLPGAVPGESRRKPLDPVPDVEKGK